MLRFRSASSPNETEGLTFGSFPAKLIRNMNLLFGVHNHQPAGNFESVFEKANQECYRPFVNTLYNYPGIKSTFHFSGSLIDWLLKNDPALLEKVKEMVKRGQVEILSGGYYEPILPIIPERDRIGQIDMLSNFIKDYFEYEPEGIWIGERVWEPQLIKTLARTGVKYTLLDDFHFRNAGIKEQDLRGYYITGKEGESVAVFPINKELRYAIPFSSSPSQVLAYLKSLSGKGEKQALTIVDDGEKFGLWPHTHKWVYHKRWLERFFRLLIKNKGWLKTQTIGEYLHSHNPLGLCEIPAAGYEEMMQWSGGAFSNFFVKYPEANNLHKRMLYVSEKVNRDENQEAKRHLYMGQCNCPYWHGVFGGIYLRHLRHKTYENLIYAQSLAEKKGKSHWIETEVLDFDGDGADELILKNPLLDIFVAPRLGGAIFELDYKPGRVNLMNAMTRRPEAYHKKIKHEPEKLLSLKKKATEIESIHNLLSSKEKGLENYLIYDSYRRLSLLDHFLAQELTLKDFKEGRYEELGDFINGQYSSEKKVQEQGVSVILQREGKVNCNGAKIPLRIVKELSLTDRDAQVCLKYKLENLSPQPLNVVFAVEFNISPESQSEANNLCCIGEGQDRVYSLKEDAQAGDVRTAHLQDAANGIECAFCFDRKTELWAYPLETASASEQGFERNYQQSVILPYWPLRLEETWQVKIAVAVSG